MSVPAERFPRLNRAGLARRHGLIEPARLTAGVTQGELATILREASIDIAERLERTLASRALVFENAMVSVGTLSNNMWSQINGKIQEGIHDAAEMAADAQFIRDLQMGLPARVMRDLGNNLRFNALQSANDIISRRTAGFTLQERIFRNGRASVLQVGKIVDRALAQQLSAREIAAQVKGYYNPNVRGGASYAAMRLGRTEINNAHHETTLRVSKERPWVQGYRWMLSGSHPRPDICDTYAHEGDGKSGEGVFSKANVPSKPHPQCLCFVMVVQDSFREFQRKLNEGQYNEYLGRRVDLPEVEEEAFTYLSDLEASNYLLRLFDHSPHWNDYLDNNPDVRRALFDYSGSGYIWMNGHLRGLKNYIDNPIADRELAKIKAIQQAQVEHVLGENLLVYRGMRAEFIEGLWESIQDGSIVGSRITDGGFMSTSSKRSVSEGFARGAQQPIIIEIELPKGTRAVYMEQSVGLDGEWELLLQSGKDMQIKSITPRDRGGYILRARLVAH